MAGGAGADTYIIDDAGDTVAEAAGGGTDTVLSSISYTLAAEVENLTLTGNAAINGTGNALNNSLAGNSAANTLSGGAGRDGLYGQAGNDRLYGGGADDRLYGGAGNDWLYAGAGADRLDGGAGADMMAGGAGNDSYVVDNAQDTVIENAGQGVDRVQTTRDSYMLDANVEDLVYQGAADFIGIGNELSNHLYGGAGNDTLMGGTGSDYLYGSAGNDLLIGGPGQDYLIFASKLDATTNLDTMFDFSTIDDRILLNGKIFTEAGLPGILASGAFFTGAAAHDGDDRIIYDKAAGALMYDRDGNGAEAATEFARLAPGLSLTNAHISII